MNMWTHLPTEDGWHWGCDLETGFINCVKVLIGLEHAFYFSDNGWKPIQEHVDIRWQKAIEPELPNELPNSPLESR